MLRKKFEVIHASNKDVLARVEITLPAGGKMLLSTAVRGAAAIFVSDGLGRTIMYAYPSSCYIFREVFASIVPTVTVERPLYACGEECSCAEVPAPILPPVIVEPPLHPLTHLHPVEPPTAWDAPFTLPLDSHLAIPRARAMAGRLLGDFQDNEVATNRRAVETFHSEVIA